jgi:hypothetical protein
MWDQPCIRDALGGARFLRPAEEQGMHRNNATERACHLSPERSEKPWLPLRSVCEAAFSLNRGEALILVLLLSLGLWAAIWGAVALLRWLG